MAKVQHPENAAQTQIDTGNAKAKPIKLGWTTAETEKITRPSMHCSQLCDPYRSSALRARVIFSVSAVVHPNLIGSPWHCRFDLCLRSIFGMLNLRHICV